MFKAILDDFQQTTRQQYCMYTVEKITSIYIISMAAQKIVLRFVWHKGFKVSLKLCLN